MKLIMEGASLLTGHYEDEMNEASGSTERNYYISGIFSTPEAKNRNGRVYSRAIWEREVEKYHKEITERSVNTLGEWQHPPRSTVDPLKAVLRITELKINEDGNVWGRAKILNDNTEQTNKLKGLIKEGIKIGVSSRGVGKVSATGIVEDFKLITYDAVDMPSDYNAMLDGVVEGVQFLNGIAVDKEYRIDENGCIGEVCGLGEVVAESEEVKVEEAETKEEKCPIAKKIEEAVAAAKEEIFAKIDEDKNELIESISDYLTPEEVVAEEVIVEEVEEVITESKTFDEDAAQALIKALNGVTESDDEEDEDEDEDEKDSTKGKCKECGKKVDDADDKLCEACESKLEDDEKDDDKDED